MYSYIVKGGKKLSGEIDISGSKNASLPILAATIISGKKSKLYNVPNIEDVRVTLEILERLGCSITKHSDYILIDSKNINDTLIPDELMKKLRSSVIMVGAIIARCRKATFSYPGGCDIGTRPINMHLKNFEKIGIKIIQNSRYINCKCDKIISKKIDLEFPSVGATENLILASILGEHEIIINNAAKEPEIIDLVNFLNKMGASISGVGTNRIRIVGVKELRDISYTIMPDRIEAGTFLVAAAITNGDIKINRINSKHLIPIIDKLEEIGCFIKYSNNSIYLNAKSNLKAANIETMPYPGFPTDLQPIFSTLLTICEGTSIVTDNIFNKRFRYMDEIKKMGADVSFYDKKIIIKGIKQLHPANLESTDLRGSASMVIAALKADGRSRISKLEYLLRGYDNFDIKLRKLGADITKEE